MFRRDEHPGHRRHLTTLAVVSFVVPVVAGCGGSDTRSGDVVARARPASREPAGSASSQQAAGTVGVVTQAGSGVLVDVAGAVRRPGVYRLGPGARVLDAITAAGGAQPFAQLGALNRAAPIVDGQQVLVLRAGPTGADHDGGGAVGGTTAGESAAPANHVSLGSATVSDLDALPGIGPVTAAKIVADRAANGAFASVDDLDRVPGIGPAMVEQLRGVLTP